MLLSLDLGTRCGWAVWRVDGSRLASGVWQLDEDPRRHRGDLFLLRLLSVVGAYKIRRIAYEHARRHTGTTAAHVFGGWLVILQIVARRTGASLHALRTQDMQAAGGVETASRKAFPDKQARREENKRRAVAAAQARGWNVVDDNEAEALFAGLASLRRAEIAAALFAGEQAERTCS